LETVPALPFPTYQVLLLIVFGLNPYSTHIKYSIIVKWKRLACAVQILLSLNFKVDVFVQRTFEARLIEVIVMSTIQNGSQHASGLTASETSTHIPQTETTPAGSGQEADAGPNGDSSRQGEEDPQPQNVATPAEHLDTGHDGQALMLEIMSHIRDDQRRVIELLEQRFHQEPEISEVARRLWSNPCDAWAGSEAESEAPRGSDLGASFLDTLAPCGSSLVELHLSAGPESFQLWLGGFEDFHGRRNMRFVWERNLVTARKICKTWSERPELYSTPWKQDFLVCAGRSTANIFDDLEAWPENWETWQFDSWRDRKKWNWSEVSFAYPNSFDNPFYYDLHGLGTIEVS
jgi:hypothetical protein